MGCCYSKPVPRAREEAGASNGRLRALVERLRPRGYSPLVETMALEDRESLLVGDRLSNSGSNLEGNDVQTRQLGESLENRESHIEQLQDRISELTGSLSLTESELESLQQKQEKMAATLQQRDEEATSYRTQIGELVAEVLELTESRAVAERELETARMQHREAEASLSAQISEVKEGRLTAERELEALVMQHDEAEAKLCSKLVQLQEQFSRIEASLATAEDENSLASKRPLELRDLVTELNEVIDWFHFGLHLNVPFHQLMVIRRDTVQNHTLGKTYMLKEWMNRLESQASWADIVAALVKIRMRGLAQRLAEKYGVPMPPEDVTTRESQPEVSQSQESQSTNAQLLAVAQTICEKLEEQDGKLNRINASLDEARSDQQIAYQKTLSAKGAVEDGQARLNVLTEEKLLIAGQLTARERDLSFLQELLHRHMRENDELKVTIEARKKEIDHLRRSLRESESKFVSAEKELRELRSQFRRVRKELGASYIRVQELERERAELQAEMYRERKKVDNALIQTADKLTTQEPVQEMEVRTSYGECPPADSIPPPDQYQHDQAMKLLSKSSGLEMTRRQEDIEREEQIRELLENTSELETIRLTWRKCTNAPVPLSKGSAVTDVDRHTAYFSDYCGIYSYEWQVEKWSELPKCPNHDHALVVVGGLLTAVGGQQHGSLTNTLLSLIGKGGDRKWKEHFPPMPTKRRKCATVVCSQKHLVVIGGVDTCTVVEVMDTSTQQWLTASSLPRSFPLASATLVGGNIYLAGRYSNIATYTWHSSVLTCPLTALLQSCKPHRLQTQSPWRAVADIPSCTSTCITLSGELVAVGGYDSGLRPIDADCVYVYDQAADSWKVISHMKTSRGLCLAVALPEDRIMVVGTRYHPGFFSSEHAYATAEIGMLTYL